jgi:uncharacterized membrane protein YidH (DUF202 family)
MKRAIYTLASTALFLPLFFVNAQNSDFSADNEFKSFLTEILQFVNETIIPFIIGIGFLVFVWGMFKYFIYGGANDDEKAKGKSLMIYATLGFVLIVIFWGVVNLLASSTGFDGDSNRGLDNVPQVPGL